MLIKAAAVFADVTITSYAGRFLAGGFATAATQWWFGRT